MFEIRQGLRKKISNHRNYVTAKNKCKKLAEKNIGKAYYVFRKGDYSRPMFVWQIDKKSG